ncbi:hypothetical protein CVT24_004153 [Panaeolus cyanescens]|uniref:RNA polymerase II degradation factor 1 n=1 Tax=Panaeolus cyanescens TaxID=181874 RepID=A0A409Y6H5_9AGAR|nr:hypothetical protein CVT24_004153 [Panaeolus cyanescens]
MSQYKSSVRPQQDSSPSSKFREKAAQLQELFPSWTNDDLLSLLAELNGDVELAATRISEGHVEMWGEVSRKKDKKPPVTAHPSKPSAVRGDSRAARGGRGGRGGPAGRGGAAVSRGRGANGSAWGSTAAPSTASDANGHAPNAPPSSSAKQPIKTPATSKLSWAQIARPQEKPAPVAPAPPAPAPPTAATAPTPPTVPAPVPATEPEPVVQPNGWEEPTTVENPSWEEEPQPPKAPEAWPAATEPPSEPAPSEPAQSPVVEVKPEVVEEKAPPEPEPVPEVKSDLKAVSPLPATAQATAVLAEPAVAATPSPKLNRPAVGFNRSAVRHKIPDQPVTLPISFGSGIEKVGMQFGSLGLSDDAPTKEPEVPAASTAAPTEPPAPAAPQSKPQPEPTPAPLPPPPVTAPAASSSLTSMFGQQQQVAPQAAPPQPPVQTLPTQPPLSHLSTSVSQPNPTTQVAPTVAAASPLPQYPQQPSAIPQQAQPPSVTTSHPPHHQPPHQAQQQQQQQQHIQHLPQQLQQNHAAAAHHSYSQHGLPSHIDPAQPVQSAAQHQTLPSATHTSYFRQTDSTGPYFHTPTPPSAQAQDSQYGSFGQLGGQAQHQQSSHLGGFNASDYSYGDTPRGFYDTYSQQSAFASRNPLGHDDAKTLPGSQPPSAANIPSSSAQGVQPHSSQPSAQPQSAGGQAPPQNYAPPVPSLPNYYYNPHPYQNQYYNTPYQSAGYIPQPFVKYPAMFQPGPPGGPGSATNPTNKQPSANVGVQPQSNPYSQGLYQQGGYDDYSHTHHSQHQHSHSLGLGQGGVGVGGGEYGKQLYGGAGQGGMQGFMGLGGQAGAGGNGPSNNAGPRASNSPESAYKPYASKDVGVSSNRNAPPQNGPQGQPQGQGQGQGNHNHNQVPQGQGFYASNRFGGGIGGAGAGGVGNSVGGPQQNAHNGPQGHLAYPQGATEPGFYGYQPRQQAYWQ